MKHARPLPDYLTQSYQDWKAKCYADNKARFQELAQGQAPRAMVISCCDSRVHATAIFGMDQGEFFMHRNIANLVPPHGEDPKTIGTAAALEYGVTALNVSHLIVMGHSACGGVKGCTQMCAGQAPALEDPKSFVGRWLDILRPGYERVKDIADEDDRARALEKQGVVVSLENLMTYPFIRDAVEAGSLTIHGLWHDIGDGAIEHYIAEDDAFAAL